MFNNNNNGQKQYDNKNKGAIFVNNKKQSNNHPDMTGKIDIEGTEYYISCWYKQSKKGEKFMSASVKRVDSVDRPAAPQGGYNQEPQQGGYNQGNNGFNDQIPF
jgi:hypothetical protein